MIFHSDVVRKAALVLIATLLSVQPALAGETPVAGDEQWLRSMSTPGGGQATLRDWVLRNAGDKLSDPTPDRKAEPDTIVVVGRNNRVTASFDRAAPAVKDDGWQGFKSPTARGMYCRPDATRSVVSERDYEFGTRNPFKCE